MTFPLLLAVFVGGGGGALTRYGIGHFIGRRFDGAFPLGTFLINVSGCFLLGLVATLLAGGAHARLLTALLATGFLGGYTTFSTYTLEGLVLYADGDRAISLLSLVAPVVLGLAAAGLGAVVAGA